MLCASYAVDIVAGTAMGTVGLGLLVLAYWYARRQSADWNGRIAIQ